MPDQAQMKKPARGQASTPARPEQSKAGPDKSGKPLMTIRDKADQITELVAKQEKGEAGQSNEGVAGLIRRYLASMSKAAQNLGDDVDTQAPGVYWDHLRNLEKRIAAGDVNDRDALALARDVVPSIREGIDQVLGGVDAGTEGTGEAPRVLQADAGAATVDEARHMGRRLR